MEFLHSWPSHDYPDSGARSEDYHPVWSYGYEGLEVFDRFALNGEDTIIQGKLYTKLYLYSLVVDGKQVDSKRMMLTD